MVRKRAPKAATTSALYPMGQIPVSPSASCPFDYCFYIMKLSLCFLLCRPSASGLPLRPLSREARSFGLFPQEKPLGSVYPCNCLLQCSSQSNIFTNLMAVLSVLLRQLKSGFVLPLIKLPLVKFVSRAPSSCETPVSPPFHWRCLQCFRVPSFLPCTSTLRHSFPCVLYPSSYNTENFFLDSSAFFSFPT